MKPDQHSWSTFHLRSRLFFACASLVLGILGLIPPFIVLFFPFSSLTTAIYLHLPSPWFFFVYSLLSFLAVFTGNSASKWSKLKIRMTMEEASGCTGVALGVLGLLAYIVFFLIALNFTFHPFH